MTESSGARKHQQLTLLFCRSERPLRKTGSDFIRILALGISVFLAYRKRNHGHREGSWKDEGNSTLHVGSQYFQKA